jgi:hypothetical protein
MRNYIFALLFCFSLPLTVGCSGSNTVVSTSLGREFTLAIDQIAVINTENMNIKFLQVTEDSRCPGDVTCITAGKVSCLIEIGGSDASNPSRVTITQTGLTDEPGRTTFTGYQLLAKVKPYPTSGKTISTRDYRLVLTVTRP